MPVNFMRTFLLLLFMGFDSSLVSSDRADETIQKAITAMGGLKNIHAIHSLVFRGFHYEGSYKQEFAASKTSNATLMRMRPNSRLVGCRPQVSTCSGQWSHIVEAYNGQ